MAAVTLFSCVVPARVGVAPVGAGRGPWVGGTVFTKKGVFGGGVCMFVYLWSVVARRVVVLTLWFSTFHTIVGLVVGKFSAG